MVAYGCAAAVSVLLATDTVELFPPGAIDTHGWVEQGATPSWTGTGNLQLGVGRTEVRADAGGGHGPSDPASTEDGVLYLPSDCPALDGWGALIRGRTFLLSHVHLMPDPTYPQAGLSCLQAVATGTSRWPDG